MLEFNHQVSEADFVVTAEARKKIASLVADTQGEVSAVRIYVSGGGCSGMNYGMTFAEEPEATDSTLADDQGFRLVIDPVALGYLQGAEVDYVDDGLNASFVFNNVFQAVGGSGACSGCGGGAF